MHYYSLPNKTNTNISFSLFYPYTNKTNTSICLFLSNIIRDNIEWIFALMYSNNEYIRYVSIRFYINKVAIALICLMEDISCYCQLLLLLFCLDAFLLWPLSSKQARASYAQIDALTKYQTNHTKYSIGLTNTNSYKYCRHIKIIH